MAKSGLQMGGASGYELASSVNLQSCTSRLFLNATWLQFSVNLLSCTLFFFPPIATAPTGFIFTHFHPHHNNRREVGMLVRSHMRASVLGETIETVDTSELIETSRISEPS